MKRQDETTTDQTIKDAAALSGAKKNSRSSEVPGSNGNIASTATSAVVRNTSGPKTAEGKQRSKYNAIKHGIFSKVVLLDGEPKSEFNAMLADLDADLQPVGRLERALVEKLAVLMWRHRRLLIAETAEIQKGISFLDWNEDRRQEDEAIRILDTEAQRTGGLVLRTSNPHILDRCIHLLKILKTKLQVQGFGGETDNNILTIVNGMWGRLGGDLDLQFQYSRWAFQALCSGEERAKNNYPSAGECVSEFNKLLEKQIEYFERKQKFDRLDREVRKRLEKLSMQIPDDVRLERFLRYESSLERAFDRALNQFERLQRMRHGQAAQPQINVNVSSL